MASSIEELPEFKVTYTDVYGNELSEGEYQRVYWSPNPLIEYNKLLRERQDAAEAEVAAVVAEAEGAPSDAVAPVL